MSPRLLLENPLAAPATAGAAAPSGTPSAYDSALNMGRELLEKPLAGGGLRRVMVQHAKARMTVWERIKVLTDSEPNILCQNWGREPRRRVDRHRHPRRSKGRDVAVYGHDFTLRAGSMDATNGAKLARLIYMAGETGIPLIGMNDSAGAFVPAGVGGLDGYSEAFTALRKISGVVPSIMCMFGFNAGGGSYLPRQGSFMIQCEDTFFGLTGPGVVKSVLGEDVTADELGGPSVHGESGVVDLVTNDELGALRTAVRLLSLPARQQPIVRAVLARRATRSTASRPKTTCCSARRSTRRAGFNTPLDITLFLQQICDHGDYFELQPQRARNLITAFGRLGGHVVGFVANNSAVASGQIDIDAARKGTRFIRFCNLYNIPLIFLEDTTGFLPGSEQEGAASCSTGRRLLDSIIDLRTAAHHADHPQRLRRRLRRATTRTSSAPTWCSRCRRRASR